MELNKKYIGIGLILLLLTWGGNIFIYESHKLDKPLFIKHYYDVPPGMGTFKLHYINNINPKDEVMYITFPEIETSMRTTEVEHSTDDRYYTLKSIQVVTGAEDARYIPDGLKDKIITKIIVHLRSGRSEEVDIGKIYLYHGEWGERNFNQDSGGSSSDNTGFSTFSGIWDVKINGISSRFPELTGDILDVNLNSMPLEKVEFPFNIKTGDSLKVDYKFEFDKTDLRKNNAYFFTLDVLTENPSGRKGAEKVFVDHWLQSPDWYDIDGMLEKGEVK